MVPIDIYSNAMNTQPSLWYIQGDSSQPAGPFPTEELVQRLQAGRLDGKTICWRQGMSHWLPMGQVEPFASAMQPSGAAGPMTARPARSPPRPKGMPPVPLPRSSPAMTLTVPMIAALIAGGLGLVVIAVIVFSTALSGRSTTGIQKRHGTVVPGSDGASVGSDALAVIIRNYAGRLKNAYKSGSTQVQHDEAVAAAVDELKTRVNECGTVAFTGRVAEIIPEGPKYGGSFRWETRNRWGISMSLPEEFEALVREGACTFGSKVWVELEKKDALSIQKGDPIAVQGAVSYIQGSVLLASDCVDIQIWPNSEQSITKGLGLGNLGSPHTIAVPISGSVTCSVGRFKLLHVHRYLGE